MVAGPFDCMEHKVCFREKEKVKPNGNDGNKDHSQGPADEFPHHSLPGFVMKIGPNDFVGFGSFFDL